MGISDFAKPPHPPFGDYPGEKNFFCDGPPYSMCLKAGACHSALLILPPAGSPMAADPCASHQISAHW